MAKHIKWNGLAVRLLHGYEFSKGEVIIVDDDDIADDILTQPNEPFEDVTPVKKERKKSARKKTTKTEESS